MATKLIYSSAIFNADQALDFIDTIEAPADDSVIGFN